MPDQMNSVCESNSNLKLRTNENANHSKILRRFVLRRVSVETPVGPGRRPWQFKADTDSRLVAEVRVRPS